MNLQIFIFLLVLVLVRLVEWDFFATKESMELPAVAASTEAQTTDSSPSGRQLTSLESVAERADIVSVPVASNNSIEERNPSLLPIVQRVRGEAEAEVLHSENTVRGRSNAPEITIVPDTEEIQDVNEARSPI